jgi:hypothetical protein
MSDAPIFLMGTSNNCRRSSGASNLPANDSALFSFRFCAVHPKDVRDASYGNFSRSPNHAVLPKYTANALFEFVTNAMLRPSCS